MIALSIPAFLSRIILVPLTETEMLMKTVVFPSKMMSFITGKLHMKQWWTVQKEKPRKPGAVDRG